MTVTGTGPNLINVVVISEGVNFHKQVRSDVLEFTYRDPRYEFHIKPRNLFIQKKMLLKRIYYRLRGIRRIYWYFFKLTGDDEGEVIGPDNAGSGNAYAKELNIATISTIIGKALDEWLGGALSGRLVLYLGIVVVVIVLAVMILTGQIALPGLTL